MEKTSPFATSGLPFRIALGGAILVFLYFYGSLIVDLIFEYFFTKGSFQEFIPLLMNVISFIIGTEIFLIITRYMISKYLENKGKKNEIKRILALYTYLLWALVGIFLISTIFSDIGALLTSIGLIGFGITFALQKPILNFVGWLTIVITKPFNIGDRIEVMGIRGDVETIHTMYTAIQGTRVDSHEKSEKVVTLPNELILTNAVINYSRKGGVFVDEIEISITYESDWRKATGILEKVADETMKKYFKPAKLVTQSERKSWHEAGKLLREASKKLKNGFVKESVKENIDILKSAEKTSEGAYPKPDIQMRLADSSIILDVIYHTDLYSIRPSRHDIVHGFMEEIEKHDDIEIAYPHMQLVYTDKSKEGEAKEKTAK